MRCRSTRPLQIVAAGVLAISSWLSEPASAQFSTSPTRSSGSTSAGMFGTRTVGGASGLTGGQRSFTGGRQQTLGQGQQVGGGQAVLGRTLQNSSSGGLTQGRFLRENRTGQFVGSDTGDLNTRALGGNQAGTAGLNALIQQQLRPQGQQGRQRNTQPNQGNSQGNRRQQPIYRVSRDAGFEVRPALGPTAFSEKLTRLVNRSKTIQVQADSPIAVEVRGRTAMLRGSVASDRARALAARLVLLEPGVDEVDNQLQVAGSEPQPE